MLNKLIISLVLLSVIIAIFTTGLISAAFTLVAFSLLFYYVINSDNKNNTHKKTEN
ncbi:hypothetical protein [Psychromonas sp. Urea-02u-13]|uniref:hypothetical protein n=1 Tax=Psychromonas sp. Urea-02u-13 TaxID=2058326 RepID=UPI0018E2F100|nr:hypothetical protein [Psychromonas sp. Urea-02u-13]